MSINIAGYGTVGQGSGTGGAGGTITFDTPDNVASGDLVMLVLGTRWRLKTANLTAPSGFSLAFYASNESDSAYGSLRVWYKIAGGSEPSSYSATWVTDDMIWQTRALRITGAAASDIIDCTSYNTPTSETDTVVIPSMNTTVDNCMILSWGNTGWAIALTAPAEQTKNWESQYASLNHTFAEGSETFATAGATGTRTWTRASSGVFNAGMLAIAPAASSTPVSVFAHHYRQLMGVG